MFYFSVFSRLHGIEIQLKLVEAYPRSIENPRIWLILSLFSIR